MPDLSLRLAGRTIELVAKNDTVLVIRCTDGTEAHISWKDADGQALEGEPKIVWYGRRVLAKTARMNAIPVR